MAKKSFKEENNESVQNITKSFFSAETLGAKETANEEEKAYIEKLDKQKRTYVKRVQKENKTENVNVRLTKNEFDKLQELSNEKGFENISSYIRSLLKKEGL